VDHPAKEARQWDFVGSAVILGVLFYALGVLFYSLPPSHPASAVARFTYCFLLGVGLMAGIRVKSFWKRMLLTAPALALAILSEVIVARMAGASSHLAWPWLCGIVFGIVLMACGGNWRRKHAR